MGVVRNTKLTFKDWLAFKPYGAFSDYDKKYHHLAVKVYDIFLENSGWFQK